MESTINIGLYLAYFLVLIAILSAVVLPLINSISHPKTLIRGGIGIVVLLVVFLVTWAATSGAVTEKYESMGVTQGVSKTVGAALVTMYILMGVALVGIIYSEIHKALK